jgi:hypothetical protein
MSNVVWKNSERDWRRQTARFLKGDVTVADIDFERRLERLFAEAPSFADAQAFALRVESRLDRGWAARRWMIGVAGVAGGLIGVSQLFVSNVFAQVGSAEASARMLTTSLTQVAPQAEWLAAVSASDGGVWMAAAMAVVTLGFVLSRVIGEI